MEVHEDQVERTAVQWTTTTGWHGQAYTRDYRPEAKGVAGHGGTEPGMVCGTVAFKANGPD